MGVNMGYMLGLEVHNPVFSDRFRLPETATVFQPTFDALKLEVDSSTTSTSTTTSTSSTTTTTPAPVVSRYTTTATTAWPFLQVTTPEPMKEDSIQAIPQDRAEIEDSKSP